MSTGYYQKNKERLQREACEKYQNVLNMKKIKASVLS